MVREKVVSVSHPVEAKQSTVLCWEDREVKERYVL